MPYFKILGIAINSVYLERGNHILKYKKRKNILLFGEGADFMPGSRAPANKN